MTLKQLDHDLKPLFLEFLRELSEDCEARFKIRQARVASAIFNNPFKAASLGLQGYNEAIHDPQSLKKVPRIGDKIYQKLVAKLKQYCKEDGYEFPEKFEGLKRKNGDIDTNDLEPSAKKRKKRAYIPRRRSGGYAILLALYMRDKDRCGLKKSEIIAVASKFCDTSFESNPGNGVFYSAWDGIKMLEKHELVSVSSRLYFLTDEGIEMARKLKAAEEIKSSPVLNRVADTSFDNGLMVSSERSRINSDDIILVDDPRMLLNSSPVKTPSKSILKSSTPKSSLEVQEIPVQELPPKVSSPVESASKIPSKTPPKIHDRKKRTLNGIKYSIWPIEEVDIIILIDSREIRSRMDPDYFQKRLKILGIDCETRQLSVGDACWIARHKVTGKEVILNVICERKKMSDFLSSIYDGRFVEQKARLAKTSMNRFYYLLEAEEKTIFDERALTSMQTARALIMTGSKFILRQFDKIEDTVKFLSQLTDIILSEFVENKVKLVSIEARTIDNQQQYGDIMKQFHREFNNHKSNYECCHLYTSFDDVMGKTQMFTVKEMFIQLLMSIKGITLDKAIQIQRVFPTPSQFFAYYNDDTVSDSVKATGLFEMTKTQVRSKKITKSLSQKLYETWGRTT